MHFGSISLISLLFFLPPALAVAADSCMTVGCHNDFDKAAYVHAPVAEQDCGACHMAADSKHPGEGALQLVEPEPQLCLQCHDNPAGEMAHTHSALADGCTGCHDPHQGETPKFVRAEGGALCLLCHEAILDEFSRPARENSFFVFPGDGLELLEPGKFPEKDLWPTVPGNDYKHGPVAAGSCLMCHGYHGGDNAAMLNMPGNTLCLACHAGIQQIMDNAVSQHEPVAHGNCWDCHTAHASDYRPFLRAYYPREFYVPFEDENFALCFNCHNIEAFEFAITSEATGFRNRHQNLHYFHVNRPDKARVCKSCHGIHGADQGKLLMRYVPNFGDWDIPLLWEPAENGATCYVGCHRQKSYDREKRVNNP